MSNLISFDSSGLSGLEDSKAASIKAVFAPMVEMLEGFEGDYNALITESSEGITDDLTKRAKRLRLAIRKVRTLSDAKRKALKEEYLRAGKAIDGVNNILKWAVQEKEGNLEAIEKHFQIQEQKRLDELQASRVAILSEYVEDAHERDLYKFKDDEFEALVAMKKKGYEDRIAAEKKAEADRIAKEKAEKEERQRIEEENKALREEAKKRERLAKIEQEKREAEAKAIAAKAEAERLEREEESRKQREAHEAQLKAEREERERVERIEREKREALEKELKAKQEAERLELEEIEAKRQLELNKGDEDKRKDLILDLETIKSKYDFDSDKNIKMYKDVGLLIDKIVKHISK